MSQNMLKTLLDRPGGRTLLGYLIGRRATSRWGIPVKIFYDECWLHRYGDDFLADWQPRSARNLPAALERYRKWWLSLYSPQPGDTIIDVGAGLGIETILFSRAVGATGRVVAIEAHPQTCECLKKTCQYNQFENVTVLNLAVTDKPGEVFIEDDPHHISNAIGTQTSHASGCNVEGRPLDDLVAELRLDSIAFLKMNIEGAERLAIKSMAQTIKRTACVAIACHDFKANRTGNEFFRTKQIITDYLVDNGFEIVQLPADYAWDADHVHAYNPRLVRAESVMTHQAARAR